MWEVYNSFLRGSSDAIVIANTETGIIEDVNPKGCELWGYDREEMIGRSIAMLHPTEDLEFIGRRFKEMVLSPEPEETVTRIIKKDGSIIPISITSANAFQIGKNKYGAGFFKDISHLDKLSEIAHHQSHMVRGPLATIMGCIHILEDPDLTEEDRKIMWEGLKDSARRMDNIIKKIVNKAG